MKGKKIYSLNHPNTANLLFFSCSRDGKEWVITIKKRFAIK